MDAQQLRARIGTISEMVQALIAEYDAELIPAETVVTSDLQSALNVASAGARLWLPETSLFTGNFTCHQPVTLRGPGRIVSPNVSPALTITAADVRVVGLQVGAALGAVTNDLVVIRGARTLLTNVALAGNGATKRGIAANGTDTVIDGCAVTNICREGQETQAIATWDGDRITIRGCTLEAGSTGFLSGGASPTVPNHVPSGIVLEDCVITRPESWRSLPYACKTGVEFKSVRGARVSRCAVSNVFVQAQTGWAFTFTPSQYGNSPETTVEDVLVEDCVIRNVAGGLNGRGLTQHTEPERQTQIGHNWRFLRNTFEISKAWAGGGHGSLSQLGGGPYDIRWEDNTVTQDGEFLRTSDIRPIAGYAFVNNRVARVGTYGIWQPTGGATRGVNFATQFPGGSVQDNTFDLASSHATFRSNFPNNIYQ